MNNSIYFFTYYVNYNVSKQSKQTKSKEKYYVVGKLLKPGEEPTNYDEENAKSAAGGDKKSD